MQKQKLTRKEKSKLEPVEPVQKKISNNQLTWLPGFIIALIGFILYSNTLHHGFTLDDYSVILENRLTKQGPSAIPEIFKTSYRYGYYFTDDNLYRPIVKAMYAIEWGISPNNATLGHWINVLLYALTGFVLFNALNKILSGNQLLSFITALLFIAHPVHTEVVASIKSRDEILAFLFCIWSLERFITFIRTKKSLTLISASVLYFIALLSKESAITFMAIFPITAWVFTSEKPAVFLKNLIPLALVAVLFLIIRNSILGATLPGSFSIADNLLEAAKDPISKLATAVLILGLYLKILIFPHPLVFDYSFNQIPIVGPSSPEFIFAAVLYLSALVFALWNLKSRNLFGYAILFYLITLSVSSNLFITIGSSMGERFLYAPSLGFCLIIALLIVKFIPVTATGNLKKILLQNKLLLPVLLMITLLYSVKTYSRNPVWKDNISLYSNDVELSPNSTRTHYYLGNYLVKPEAWEGKSEVEKTAILRRGINELKRSVEIYPAFADAHTQMGVAYFKLNNLDSAMICYQNALRYNPNFATIHNNIGTIFFSQQRYDEALKAFTKAIQLDPRYAEAYANAGSAYGMLQQYDNALSYLFNAIKWDPNYAQAYFFIGITYQFKGDKMNSTAYLEKAYKLDPSLRPKK